MADDTTNYENLEMGPCAVNFKGTDLGLTKGGVEVKISTTTTDINVDQFGDSVIDTVIKGRAVTVTVPMAERDLTKLGAVIPGSTLVTSGSAKKLVVQSGVGQSLRALAGALSLHPTASADTDKSRDFNVPLAMCAGDMTFSYKVDEQRVFSVEFNGFVDLSTGNLLIFGDPALVAA